jgi:hypothetical protein
MKPPIAILNLRKEPHYRRNAFEQGLKRLGYYVGNGLPDVIRPAGPDDLLVLWNKKRGHEEAAADRWEKLGGTVIVTENAYLQKVDKTAYAISTHGHNGSGWFPVWPDNRFFPLGYEVKPLVNRPEGYVLVCGQRGIGSTLMASPPQWGEKVVKKLQGGKVKLRAHPGNFAPRIPLLDDLAGAREARIWSSSAGVTALLEGVPVSFDAPHWICGGWEHNREAALNRMAHGQWSVAEIESGEPFARMKAENWGPRWV